ncbi:MAG: translocation/assembly module TamB domain-containing protein [Myxococcota bacterium]
MVKEAPKSKAPPAVLPATPAPAEPRSPRRRPVKVVGRLFRRVAQVLLLSVVVLVALAVGWLRSDDFQIRAMGVAENLIETALGEEATLTRVSVQFWPPGVDVEGFHVFSAETGETLLSAEQIQVPLAIGWTGPRVGQITLRGPTIHLQLDERGKLVEFENRRTGGRPLRRLPWSSLRVLDGTVLLTHPNATVELSGLALQPRHPWDPTTDLSAALNIEVRDPNSDRTFTDSAQISWSGVVLGPDVIEVPDLAIATRTLDLTGRATVPLRGALDVDLSARARLDEIESILAPPRKVHGVVDLDLHLGGPASDPVATVAVSGEGLGLDMPGVFTPLLTYEFGAMSGSAVASKAGVDIEQVVLPWANGRVVAWGRITPDKRLEDGHVTLEDVSLAPLLQAFDGAPHPWIDFSADGEIAWSGTLAPLDLQGTLDFGVADLEVANQPIANLAGRTGASRRADLMLEIPTAYAQGSLRLEKTHILLELPTVRGPNNSGTASIDIGFGPRGPLDLSFDLVEADLSTFQPLGEVGLKGTGNVYGRIAGPFNKLQFVGRGDVRDFEVLGIEYADHLVADLSSPNMKSIWLDGADATLGSSHYTGRYSIDFRPPISMSTEIRIDHGRVEDMVNMFVDLDGLRGDLTGTLALDGPLMDMSGEAHLDLRNSEIYGETFPVGEAHGYMDQGVFTLDDLRVRRDEGRAGVTLRGKVDRAWKLDMELVADGFDLAKLDRLEPYDLNISGKLGGVSRITNTLFDPSPDGRIWLTDLRYAGVSAGDSAIKFDTEGGVAAFRGDVFGKAAHVDGTLGLWQEQPYALTARLDALPAHLFYPVAADGSPITAEVSGTVDVSGDLGAEWSPVAIAANLADVQLRYQKHHLKNETPWIWSQEGNRFELQDINLSGGSTRLALTGTGVDPLDLQGGGTVDLDLLRAVVPGLDKSTGTAEVKVYASGSRPNVEAVVDVDVRSELFRHSAAPLSFEDARARLRVRKDRIDVLSLDGGLGGGTFSGSGTIEAEGWIPTRYDLRMSAKDAMVQWVESLPPAIGDGTFQFDGPTNALLLSGEVQVKEMVFADRIDWEDSVVEYRDWMLVDPASVSDEPPMFSLNVKIEADDTIHLQNNIAEGRAVADLRVIGDTVRPGLVGTVVVEDDGMAFLQDREFRIDRGILLFNDPWTWDPQLDISLITDITSRDTRYRVDYQVQGPFSNWHTVTHSDPSLPQADVNALLWFGVTTDELEEMGELSTAVVQGVADMMLTDFFVSGQAGDLDQGLPDFLFDRIDLATGVNARGEYSSEPRLVIEKRVANLGDVDLKGEVNMIRPDEIYGKASWKIGGIWSLSGWYSTLQRDRVLPIGGAYGVDVLARWEIE